MGARARVARASSEPDCEADNRTTESLTTNRLFLYSVGSMTMSLSRHGLTVALFACLLAGSPAAAGQRQAAGPAPPVAPDVERLGPQVGSKALPFALPDQSGRTRTLDSLMGPKGLMLVFSRSADWCPYCKTQLVEMRAGWRICTGTVSVWR